MSLRRLALLALASLCLLSLISCGGTQGASIDVPASLRERVAREYPEFDIVGAEGSTVTGASEPGLTEQDVIFQLRHKTLPFFTTQQYDQVFNQGSTPPGWTATTGEGELSFAGAHDTRARSFIQFFLRRYPAGEYVVWDIGRSDPVSGRERYVARLFPRQEPRGFGCSVRRGDTEDYVYDPRTGTWSAGQ